MTNTVNLTFCLSDAAPEQPDLTCPIRRYWNSSLRSKPSRQVRRESCQSWYNFPPASSFFSFCSLTNFRATTRLETRATQAIGFQKGLIPREGTQQIFSLGTSALQKRYPLGYFL